MHGDSYKQMLTYFKDAVVDPTALQLTSQARDIIAEETDMYFKQDQDIDTTLQNMDTCLHGNAPCTARAVQGASFSTTYCCNAS